MRFSIRDLLWATALVAMGMGWWVSYWATNAKRLEAVQQTHRHRATLELAKHWHETLRKIDDPKTDQHGLEVLILNLESPINWSVLDEPLVEP